jgi:small subunit ribosomal protein S15
LPKKERGRSHSTRPVTKRPPVWCKYTAEEVEALIVKEAKDGQKLSMIGMTLRDRNGIPLVKAITGKRIGDTLREAKLYPDVPEGLAELVTKASRLKKHMEKNKTDYVNKRSLILIEAKIHGLSRYYKKKCTLPKDWAYKAAVMKAI